jgi:histidine decarboxylase
MLACKGNIAHVVGIEKLVDFLDELVQKRATWFEDEKHLCIVSIDVGYNSCLCALHKLL